MLKKISTITALVLSLGILPTQAQETKVQGVRVDFAYDFKPGEGLTGKQSIEEAIGEEKIDLDSALSLGVGGEVKVVYTKGTGNLEDVTCFYNGPSYDIFIHEPNTSNNRPETVEILVGLEKDPKTSSWISLGTKSVKEGTENYIPFDLDENEINMEIQQGYRILVRDAKSRLTISGRYAGFELSTVIFKYPCDQLIASKRKGLISKLN